MIFPQSGVMTTNPASTNSKTIGKEIAYDFEKGTVLMQDGDVCYVEDVEALKIWIMKAIYTARYRWPIYSWNYGSEIEDLIGRDLSQGVLESEVKRMIEEAIEDHSCIVDVKEFSVEKEGDVLNVTLTVDTTLNEEVEVSIVV